MVASLKSISNLQILDDSMIIIKWMKEEYNMKILVLRPIYKEVNHFEVVFNAIPFFHVHKEINNKVDSVFKEGLLVDVGSLIVLESKNG
jgi:hypothetical protein